MTDASGKFGRSVDAFRESGVAGLAALVRAFRRKRANEKAYERYIEREAIDDRKRAEMLAAIEAFGRRPKLSVILPVYNIDEIWLVRCIDSVRRQIYRNWELCIADDASTREHIRPLLERYAAEDDRIKTVFRPENGHISAASNSALEIATGDFCILLDHDDELSEDALFYVASEMNAYPKAKMIFSDEDVIDTQGTRSDPKFKPEFSPDLMLSLNMVTHLSAYDTDVLREIGGFRLGLEGSQDYDLALRVIERISPDEIRRIPRVLYHWRAVDTSVAASRGAKPYAFEKARVAIAEHLERTGVEAEVLEAADGLNRVRYPHGRTSISLIAVGGERRFDIESCETIYVNGDDALARGLNEAVMEAHGATLVFLDRSLVPRSSDWIEELASFTTRDAIGVVGCKILRKDGAIGSTGFVLGGPQIVRDAHRGFLGDANGYFFRAGMIGNYSAVSWRAMAVRRSVFEKIGGFRADDFPDELFDVDLCLRLWQRGLRVVYTPYAVLRDTSDAEEGHSPSALARLSELWPAEIERDRFYNPNLSLAGEPFEIDA
ncbi:MAG: glycosyltransferase [Acidobacteria bacterium OLB17]|nr:MAG: glycosyltransferase [Acidobacteria bacterium OLB17]MCZ2390561.1 glycosyltransferase [Acidobacteriota bacterium]